MFHRNIICYFNTPVVAVLKMFLKLLLNNFDITFSFRLTENCMIGAKRRLRQKPLSSILRMVYLEL